MRVERAHRPGCRRSTGNHLPITCGTLGKSARSRTRCRLHSPQQRASANRRPIPARYCAAFIPSPTPRGVDGHRFGWHLDRAGMFGCSGAFLTIGNICVTFRDTRCTRVPCRRWAFPVCRLVRRFGRDRGRQGRRRNRPDRARNSFRLQRSWRRSARVSGRLLQTAQTTSEVKHGADT